MPKYAKPRKHREKLLTYLLEDVARLPTISGRAQWLPLLRQIQRGVTLGTVRQESDRSTYNSLHCALHDELSAFNGYCRALGMNTLNVPQVASCIERFFADPFFIPSWLGVNSRRAGSSTLPEDVQQEHEKRGLRIIYLLSLLPPAHRVEYPHISYEPDVDVYFAEIHNTYVESKNRLVEGTLRYVFSIARLYVGRGVPFLDLVQEGTMGLMRAAETYSELQGAHFQQYASIWIRQTISRAIADQSRLIRIPAYLNEQVAKLKPNWDKLIARTGKIPSLFALSEKQGWLTTEDIDALCKQSQFNELMRRIRPYIEAYELVRSTVLLRRTAARQLRLLAGRHIFNRSKDGVRSSNNSNCASPTIAFSRQNLSSKSRVGNTSTFLSKRGLRRAIQKWYEQSARIRRQPLFEEFSLEINWLSNAEIQLYRHCYSLGHSDAVAEARKRLSEAKKEYQKMLIAFAHHFPIELLRVEAIASSFEEEAVYELPDNTFEVMRDLVASKEFRENFATVSEDLNPRAQQILEARYGLNGGEGQTLEEIAQPRGLTRERVRQIESAALRKLRHPSLISKLEFASYDTYETSSAVWERTRRQVGNMITLYAEHEEILAEERTWRQLRALDCLLQKYLLRGRRIVNTRSRLGRASLFRQVLIEAGEPLHYSIIHERALALIPEELGFSKKSTYATLFYGEQFRAYSQGVFGLAEWTPTVTEVEGIFVLKQCPTPLLKSSGKPRGFFETIFQGQSWLQTRSHMSARQFYLEMLAWAGRSDENAQEAQMAFDAWYAAGLIERVNYLEAPQTTLRLTLPDGMRLADTRSYCLNLLCQRIEKMSELLLVIEQVSHPKLATIQKVLFGTEKAGYDVPARLTLLAAFDAVRKDGDEWQLTTPGKNALASNPPQELPDFSELAAIEEEDAPDEVEWEEDLGLLTLDVF